VPESVAPVAAVPEPIAPVAAVPEPIAPVAAVPEPIASAAAVPEPIAPAAAVPEPVDPVAAVPLWSIEQCRDLLHQNPECADVHARVAELFKDDEQPLVGFYRQLTQDQPDQLVHLRILGRAYVRIGKPLLGAIQLQKFLMSRPDAAGYRELADIYRVLNREKNASDATRRAEEIESRTPAAVV
jgi:hypothetical protein